MKNLVNIVSEKVEGKIKRLLMICALAAFLLTGCSAFTTDEGYTREELDNLARLEVYEAGDDKLLRTIEDEEILYQYAQTGMVFVQSFMQSFESDWEEGEKDLKEAAENAGASYYIVAYKHPASKFGNKEPEKNMTITLYQGTNVAKMVVDDGNVKNIPMLEEFLTFYYEMTEEESAFYGSLLEES